jgi:glycosyltransferase involved in cell wall biosynthesis
MSWLVPTGISERQAVNRGVTKQLKVRVGGSYNARYNTHRPPGNVKLVARPLTPLTRISEKLDSFALIEPAGYDLIHSFNAIPVLTRTPFIVTFEDYCPRTPEDRPVEWLERRLRKVLLSENCIGIVAMSEYALRKFKHQHCSHSELSELLAKTTVVYPAMPASTRKAKCAGDKLSLLFVGRDFIRKGGPAVLDAHRRLAARGIPVDTTIVSDLRWSEDDYIGPPDPERSRAVMNSIRSRGIRHFPGLPHAQVTDLMRQADYLLLPTFHDTFGYVTLEAMSNGTPAIATSTCAQNEMIEHGRSGYLLDFDNDPVTGDWRWLYCQKKPGYVDAYWQESETMAHELAERLARAWEDRKNYEAMSAAAIQRVTKRFSIAQAQRRLAPLYEIARSRRRGVLCLASENSSTSMNINASVESGTFANNLPCLRDALPSAPPFRSSAKN